MIAKLDAINAVYQDFFYGDNPLARQIVTVGRWGGLDVETSAIVKK